MTRPEPPIALPASRASRLAWPAIECVALVAPAFILYAWSRLFP